VGCRGAQARGREVEKYCEDKLSEARQRADAARAAREEELRRARADTDETRRKLLVAPQPSAAALLDADLPSPWRAC
jgi:hypothetical protein